MQEINKRNARIWSMLGMRRVVGMLLGELAEADPAMMFATADVARYFGTEEFQKNYPDHYIDVGIAEQNLVGVAAERGTACICSNLCNLYHSTYPRSDQGESRIWKDRCKTDRCRRRFGRGRSECNPYGFRRYCRYQGNSEYHDLITGRCHRVGKDDVCTDGL